MSVELLERAITRLEELKDGASWLPWAANRYAVVGDLADGDYSEIICGADTIENVALIATLSRTVDPMLAMLRRNVVAIRGAIESGLSVDYVNEVAELAGDLNLARSILGVNDDD